MAAGEKRYLVMDSNEISICGFATIEEANTEAIEMSLYHGEKYHVEEFNVVEFDGKLVLVSA